MNGQTIGYIRVSSIDQNIDRQLEQLKHCEPIFTDKVSGKDIERLTPAVNSVQLNLGDFSYAA